MKTPDEFRQLCESMTPSPMALSDYEFGRFAFLWQQPRTCPPGRNEAEFNRGWDQKEQESIVPGVYVKFGGAPGYSYEGEVIAECEWEGDPMVLVRYWFNPKGDPPRKSYRLIQRHRCKPSKATEGYVPAVFTNW